MDFDLGSEAERLRVELRELIAEHVPRGFLGAFAEDDHAQDVADKFCAILAERGLLTLAWPEEYGGRGASVWEQIVVREEMWAHNEPRGAQYMGLNWIGPAIMRFGTQEQKLQHLTRIAKGSVIWCQGFSEPEAGSDLASLRTTATPVDDGWRVTGQKVWTSYATMADWCFMAVRTSTHADRRHGISILLVPMDRQGVEVRPIASMLGPHHLNEVYFDDVPVYHGEMLGEEGQGWEIINAALAFERVGIARYARADRLLDETLARLPEDGRGLDPRLVRGFVETRIARLLAYDALAGQAEGDIDLAAAASARIAMTTNEQDIAEALMDHAGAPIFSAEAGDSPWLSAVEDYWRYARAATVASGTIEIQRTLLARSVLGAR